jgi:hypothetical protein
MTKTVKTLDLIVGTDKIDAAIKANQKAHSKVDHQWHLIGVSTIAHFEQHGDTGPMNRMFKAMGKGARHVAMEAWLLAFGGVLVNEDKKAAETNPFVKDRSETAKKPDIAAATAQPWFNFKPSPDVGTVIDYLALALKVVRRGPKEDQSVENGDLRAALVETIQKYADAHGIEGLELPSIGEADATADALAGVSEE